MSVRPVDSVVSISGLRLHYLEWGDPTKNPILCIGGIIQEAHIWDAFAASMSADYRVICLDLRGQGESEWTDRGYSTKDFMQEVREFAVAVGIVPFHFVGHSLGARIALAYGGEYPDNLKSIVLSDTGPGVNRPAALGVRSELAEYFSQRNFTSKSDVVEFFQKLHPEWQSRFHEGYGRFNFRKNWAGYYVPRADPNLYYITTSASLPDLDYMWTTAEAIRAPTLLLWGARTGSISFVNDDIVDRMRAVMANFVSEKLDVGHYTMFEQPEEFESHVRSFVGAHNG